MTPMTAPRWLVVAGVALGSVALAEPPVSAVSPHVARLACAATVSNAHPAYGSTVKVIVRTRARALVRTTAHYKTTDTTHSARASSAGTAVILYRLSRATRGFQVKVSVSVRLGALAGACATSFTPR